MKYTIDTEQNNVVFEHDDGTEVFTAKLHDSRSSPDTIYEFTIPPEHVDLIRSFRDNSIDILLDGKAWVWKTEDLIEKGIVTEWIGDYDQGSIVTRSAPEEDQPDHEDDEEEEEHEEESAADTFMREREESEAYSKKLRQEVRKTLTRKKKKLLMIDEMTRSLKNAAINNRDDVHERCSVLIEGINHLLDRDISEERMDELEKWAHDHREFGESLAANNFEYHKVKTNSYNLEKFDSMGHASQYNLIRIARVLNDVSNKILEESTHSYGYAREIANDYQETGWKCIEALDLPPCTIIMKSESEEEEEDEDKEEKVRISGSFIDKKRKVGLHGFIEIAEDVIELRHCVLWHYRMMHPRYSIDGIIDRIKAVYNRYDLIWKPTKPIDSKELRNEVMTELLMEQFNRWV